MDDLRPGAYVTKAVRLLRPLAQGGMGTVWVAEHLVLHTEVVVKFMSRGVEYQQHAAERFAREAAVAAAVRSPHVVQVFDSGVTETGTPYIVMELLEGHDLSAHLTRHGRMAPRDLAVVIAQLARALSKAHRVGIVHRDIKPENIFLCDVEGAEPFVKLLDFGTAKGDQAVPSTTTTGELVGTPYYMSPEQILGEKEIDARSDLWSLGVVVFEALTGSRPFDGSTVGAITLAIHTTEPRVTDLAPELPEAIDLWFARACARDLQTRFASARELAEALVDALSLTAPHGGEWPGESLRIEATGAFDRGELSPGTFPPVFPVVRSVTPQGGTSASVRPVAQLSSTLPSRASERRATTIAAAVVALATLAVMVGLVLHGATSAGPAAVTPAVAADRGAVAPKPPEAAASASATATAAAPPPSAEPAPATSGAAPRKAAELGAAGGSSPDRGAKALPGSSPRKPGEGSGKALAATPESADRAHSARAPRSRPGRDGGTGLRAPAAASEDGDLERLERATSEALEQRGVPTASGESSQVRPALPEPSVDAGH